MGMTRNLKEDEEDITVEELLPLIKNLVDRHNKLQQEYDILDRELSEQKMRMEDKINKLDIDKNRNNKYLISEQEHKEKMELLKNNYDNNLLSISSEYEQDIDQRKKVINKLTKKLNDADKENDALRESLEAIEHENNALRLSINNKNKQHQKMQLVKNKNKQLLLENDAMRQQIDALEEELDALLLEKEQNKNNDINIQHQHSKTIMMEQPMLSDHASSNYDGNDLLHQIEDAQNFELEEKENENEHSTILTKLSKYKNIGAMDPESMQQIMALLQEKEDNKRKNSSNRSGQNVIDNLSLESNYSDSEQKIGEQIDCIEDDIRELKDMVLSLMDSTNNITPQINANLGPLVRKINRIYVMLSGPTLNRRQIIDEQHNDTETESAYTNNQKSMNFNLYSSLYSFIPYINDWIPSIGFSAIILSTMYLLIKYHKGKFIGIGQPRVLRNKRSKK